MAIGKVTFTNHGVHSMSGASLKTAVDAVNLGIAQLSGAQLFIVPFEHGQVMVYSTAVELW